jgi:hypothetical protein
MRFKESEISDACGVFLSKHGSGIEEKIMRRFDIEIVETGEKSDIIFIG